MLLAFYRSGARLLWVTLLLFRAICVETVFLRCRWKLSRRFFHAIPRAQWDGLQTSPNWCMFKQPILLRNLVLGFGRICNAGHSNPKFILRDWAPDVINKPTEQKRWSEKMSKAWLLSGVSWKSKTKTFDDDMSFDDDDDDDEDFDVAYKLSSQTQIFRHTGYVGAWYSTWTLAGKCTSALQLHMRMTDVSCQMDFAFTLLLHWQDDTSVHHSWNRLQLQPPTRLISRGPQWPPQQSQSCCPCA